MKPFLSLMFMYFLSACVSVPKYQTRLGELEHISAINKALRKEIRAAEQKQQLLKDSLQIYDHARKSVSESLKLRLLKYGIKARFTDADLAALSFRRSALNESSYQYMRSRYTETDTHTASRCNWLSPAEKKMYYYLNYARLDPQGFCRKFVMPELKNDTGNLYLLTLIDYLMEMKPVNAVRPDKTQFDNARCHAETSGKSGYVGHGRQSGLCKTSFRGECCAYGNSDPLEVIMQLLVDSGVPSLGHRYICLGWYEYAGIASAAHKTYGTNVVLDFK